MDISLVIACSAAYRHHLDGYLQAVHELDRAPDEIVLVTDSVSSSVEYKRVLVDTQWNLGAWYNAGVAASSGDWVVWTGADDRFMSHALNSLDDCKSDVYAFGLQYTTGQVWLPQNLTAQRILEVRENLVPCGSPFRRHLWEQVPFQPQFFPLDDWAFWVGCAAIGATFECSPNLDVLYEYGPSHINPPMEPTRTHIAQWVRELQ